MSPDPSLSAGNEPRDELHLLASRLVDNQLTDAERDRLLTLLTQRPDLHQDYLHHLTVHAYLDWMHRPPDSPELEGDSITSPAVRPRSRRIVSWLKDLGRDYAREPVALAVLVVVMISGGILFWNLSQLSREQRARQVAQQPALGHPQATVKGEPRAPARGAVTADSEGRTSPSDPNPPRTANTPPGADTPGSPRSVAGSPSWVAGSAVVGRLTRTAGATWAQDEIPKDGANMKDGQKLSLKSGLAEIAFKTGAKIILEGPAEFEIESRKSEVGSSQIPNPKSEIQNSCSLNFGKLYAHVPTQARGFTVHTPNMTIVDLGTEFGVEVGTRKLERETRNAELPRSNIHVPRSTLTEVHVLRGEVSVQPTASAITQTPPATPTSDLRPPTLLKAGEAAVSVSGEAAPRVTKAEPVRFVRELPAEQPGASAHPLTEPGAGAVAQRWSARRLMPGDIVAVTRYTHKLVKIDPRSGRQTLLFRGDRATHGSDWMCAAVDAQGRVLIGVDFGRGMVGGGVLRFDPRQNKMDILAQGGILDTGRVSGLAVAADGTIHATLDSDKDYVVSIDPQSGAARAVAPFGNNVWGISTDAKGRGLLAVSDGPPGSVARIQNGAVKEMISDPSLGGARGVAVTPDGRTFVSVPHSASRSIVEIDWRRRKVVPLASAPAGASDDVALLAAEADGNLIVGVFSSPGQIYRVDVAGKKCSVLASGGDLEYAGGVAVVPGGD